MKKNLIGFFLILGVSLAAYFILRNNFTTFGGTIGETKWLACEVDSDCTHIDLGGDSWQPVNKKFADAMEKKYGRARSIGIGPPWPMPTPKCVNHKCK
jgi:hypothetical protein